MAAVLSVEEAGRARRPAGARRASGIVLANGCFDLLHVGHVRYLQAARALGDVLFVGLNSDASVATPQGPGPAADARPRSAPSCSRRCAAVDHVVVFEEDTRRRADRAASAPTCTPRAPTTPSRHVPERGYGATRSAAGWPSSATPRTHSTRDLIARHRERASARADRPDGRDCRMPGLTTDRPRQALVARRRRPRAPGGARAPRARPPRRRTSPGSSSAREAALLRDHPGPRRRWCRWTPGGWRRLDPAPLGRARGRRRRSGACAAAARRALRRRPRPAGPDQERGAHRRHRRAAPHRLRRGALPRGAERALHQPARDAARRGACTWWTSTWRSSGRSASRRAPVEFHAADRRHAPTRGIDEFLGGPGSSRATGSWSLNPGRGPRRQAVAGRALPPSSRDAPRRRSAARAVLVLWGPDEVDMARAIARRASARRDARAAHRPATSSLALLRRAARHGGRRHRAAAPGRRARHAVRRSLRADARRAQRPLRPRSPRAPEPRRHDGRRSTPERGRSTRRRACSAARRPRREPAAR